MAPLLLPSCLRLPYLQSRSSSGAECHAAAAAAAAVDDGDDDDDDDGKPIKTSHSYIAVKYTGARAF